MGEISERERERERARNKCLVATDRKVSRREQNGKNGLNNRQDMPVDICIEEIKRKTQPSIFNKARSTEDGLRKCGASPLLTESNASCFHRVSRSDKSWKRISNELVDQSFLPVSRERETDDRFRVHEYFDDLC